MKRELIIKRLSGVLFEFTIMATVFTWLNAQVFLLGVVPTESMYPSIPIGARVFATRSTYNLKIGDVIVFKAPELSNDYFIKRVIGLPNDEIEARDGELYVNGWYVDSIKEFGAIGSIESDFICKESGYFVMGDNLNNSLDSRYIGTIKSENIIAKMVFKF
jgi:signal peptidase I